MADDKKIEILSNKKSQETIDAEKGIKDFFEKSKSFDYLKNNLEPTSEGKNILDKVTNTFQNLSLSTTVLEKSQETLRKKYDFSKDISIEELAVIDTVENDIGKNLEPKDKLKLIRLLSGVEIKEKKLEYSTKINKSEYSKKILKNPETPIVERLYQNGDITEKNFKKFIKSESFTKGLENLPKEKREKIEKLFSKSEKLKGNEKDFFNTFNIPEEAQEQFIIKEIAKNYINIGEKNNEKVKKLNIVATIEKTLNKFLKQHKYFYKPMEYFEQLELIRNPDIESENLNEIFKKRLNSLAYVMQLAGINPLEIEEKHLEAGEQAKAVELKEEKFENKELGNKNKIYEKIKILLKKNDNLGQNKIFSQKAQLEQIRLAEVQEKTANNPDYQKEVLNDFIA